MQGKADVIEAARAPSRILGLVERAQGGDRDAFGELYQLYYAGVFRMARLHLPRSEVEDAVAEAFLQAWKSLPRYRYTGAPFAAWLYGITRHVVASAGRRRQRVMLVADPPDQLDDPEDRVEDRLDLAAAVALLGKEQRQVIELKFFMGLRNEEVSRALGKTVGAVNALQWRALAALCRMMGSR